MDGSVTLSLSVAWGLRLRSLRTDHRSRSAHSYRSSALAAQVVAGSTGDRGSVSPDLPLQIVGFEVARSEEHTSELQSLMRISYAVFCLKKNNKTPQQR